MELPFSMKLKHAFCRADGGVAANIGRLMTLLRCVVFPRNTKSMQKHVSFFGFCLAGSERGIYALHTQCVCHQQDTYKERL